MEKTTPPVPSISNLKKQKHLYINIKAPTCFSSTSEKYTHPSFHPPKRFTRFLKTKNSEPPPKQPQKQGHRKMQPTSKVKRLVGVFFWAPGDFHHFFHNFHIQYSSWKVDGTGVYILVYKDPLHPPSFWYRQAIYFWILTLRYIYIFLSWGGMVWGWGNLKVGPYWCAWACSCSGIRRLGGPFFEGDHLWGPRLGVGSSNKNCWESSHVL